MCTFWMRLVWRRRYEHPYRYQLTVRRPFYILISLVLMMPMVLEEGLATIYLFWVQAEPSRSEEWHGANQWTQYNGNPIYFDRDTDLVLHFFFWFGFIAFFQFKICKFLSMRFVYEYNKGMTEITNTMAVWTERYELSRYQSMVFRYKHLLIANSCCLFSLQSVILVIILCIQILIRFVPTMEDSPSAPLVEMVVIFVIFVVEFVATTWSMHSVQSENDSFFLKLSFSRFFFVSLIGATLWMLGLIVVSEVKQIGYIYIRCAAMLLLTSWIGAVCYFETAWILKLVDKDSVKNDPVTKEEGTAPSLSMSSIMIII